ncbi:PaaI family thioesterase [Novispirillum itersonii]|uniref:PaaI family thioesterase n=1 Tax=Novispirillum itersonii TaxID=189 RepID=UPI00037C1CF2|nr:PaaI family thioesterase [Novispirillum itersonii]
MTTAVSPSGPHYGVLPLAEISAEDGMTYLNGILEGRHPAPPIARTLGFGLGEISPGHAVFEGTPTEDHYNPIGTVHAGFAATLLDSCMACSVHTTLKAGEAYTTLEFKINLVRAITVKTGPVRAIGTLIHRGSRIATAEGKLVDADGKIYATATTTCMIMAPGERRAGEGKA